VQLRDAAGNAVARGKVTISAAIASGGGNLGGTTSQATDASGGARFGKLRVSGDEGANVTLAFTAPGFTQLTSAPIAIKGD